MGNQERKFKTVSIKPITTDTPGPSPEVMATDESMSRMQGMVKGERETGN